MDFLSYIKNWRHDVLLLLGLISMFCLFSDNPDGNLTKALIVSKVVGFSFAGITYLLHRYWRRNGLVASFDDLIKD